ncbi:hypothetical protein Tco_0583462 [Tanacetum coccineum]
MELNELIEFRDGAYENTPIYKELTKRWHDSRLQGDKNFKAGDKEEKEVAELDDETMFRDAEDKSNFKDFAVITSASGRQPGGL